MRTKQWACTALGLLLLAGCHSHKSASLTTPLSRNALQNASSSGFADAGAFLARYTVTNLGTIPGSVGSEATGINDKGQVIGQCGDRAFLWENGRMRDLGTLRPPYGPDYDIAPSCINNRGQIVGTLFLYSNGTYIAEERRAFMWSGGRLHLLMGTESSPFQGTSLSEFTDSEAAAINDRGEVVGTAGWTSNNIGPEGPRHAFLYRNKRTHDLGPGTATSINNKGEVCGYVPLDNGGSLSFNSWTGGGVLEQSRIALLWTKGRRITMGCGIPYVINDTGIIVGCTYNLTSFPDYDDLQEKTNFFLKARAALWKQGKFRALNTGGNLPGKAQAVNRQGQIVGGHWLWQNGRTYDLNELIPNRAGWTLQQATGINNRGQIVGGGMFQGKKRAFLLTPGR